ncbi:MAG TPA: ATP-binding cassette domain-containing protein [Prolixibacteraceae bacterium]|nr:ATP-binding cassette domain-containing protein [Prolixibacteraceae bacterium]
MSDNSFTSDIDRKEILFQIDKLSCAYNNGQPVLEAENIYIPKRKITVLLGSSGSGKSTLLETLGLMTKTVDHETSSIRFYPNDTEEYDLANIWSDDQEDDRYRIRKLYYSFIFQSTNLMANFSALENVGLTELIQNKPESEAYFNAIESLVKNLSVTSLSYTKKPFEFSGGERQRLAFARAINPEFTVLFGDEPTGNLDHFNSVKLMHFVREFVTKQRENVSVIIVSHNIPLTLDFTDRIIVLTKKENGVSTIDPHFIYDRDRLKWYESRREQLKLQKEIELLLNSDTESFARILMHLSESNVPDAFFNEIKESMINQQIMVENDGNYSVNDKNSYQEWRSNKLEENQLLNPKVKEYIRQFAHGEQKKVEIKINDVIRTIQDLKFKTAVERHRDRKKENQEDDAENQEFRGGQSIIGSILGFIPWLILSIAPFCTFLIEKFFSLFRRKSNHLSKKKQETTDESDTLAHLRFSFKEIIPTIFYRLCVAWDGLNVSYKIFVKYKLKIKGIRFNPIPHDFKHLFYRNETKELLGKKNKNFWLIVVILFFTFLAIGFSSGSLDYLKDKMEDPFVRSINAPIPATNRNAFKIIDRYNSDSLKQEYNYDTIVGYNKWTTYFQGDLAESPHRAVDGRSIPFDDPLVNTIVDKKINHSEGTAFTGERDISIIVTRNLIEKLGCSENPTFLYRKTRDGRAIPIPIRAIVDKLPGEKIDFMTTQYYYSNSTFLGDRFLFADNKKLYAYVVFDTLKIDEFKQTCDNFFEKYTRNKGKLEPTNVDVFKYPNSYKSVVCLQVSFNFSENIVMTDIDELYKLFRESDEVKQFIEKNKIPDNEILQAYYPNLEDRISKRYDYMAVNFNDLSRVDSFAVRFAEDADIKLEMSKIEQMKNYNFVSKLTGIMSLILICFSVIMINIFLSNILSTHLNKIKKNIGTFKAFGIDIKRIYMGMMYNFVLLPLVLSLLLAALAGYAGAVYYLIDLISPFEIEKALYFDLYNSYTLISILVLAIVNYYAFSLIINRIFKQTPGDLIYDRNNKA